MAGLYIHIPFCVSKCFYCDFVSYGGKLNLAQDYLKAVKKESSFYDIAKPPRTVYIGGGTPSVLPLRDIEFLLKFISEKYGAGFEEFTFECNPESVNEEKLSLLKDYGVNRISLGLQSFNDEELKLIGRAHRAADFLRAYEAASKYFNNINVDLIAALPSQSEASFLAGLKKLISLNPKHISLYGLQIEQGTGLYERGYSYDEDFYVRLLELGYKELTANGFKQYEISNYAREGFESVHNINYWFNGEYLGLGAAASGYLKGVRYQNICGIEEYIKRVNEGIRPAASEEKLKGKAKIGEEILLRFRYLKGFKPSAQMLKYFGGEFEILKKEGLIEADGELLKLSHRGKYLANEVFRRFVEPF